MLERITVVGLLTLLIACEPGEQYNRAQHTRQTAIAYFDVYQQRTDWDSLLSFYREDIQFKDATLNYQSTGIDSFKRFYNWPNTSFRKVTDDQKHLVIQDLVVQDSIVVGRGHINPFFWNNELQDWTTDFTIWLYFDQDMKIYKQIDWVNYPPWMIQTFGG